eukprot:15219968-Alexandrium_andersonii.AAC.1
MERLPLQFPPGRRPRPARGRGPCVLYTVPRNSDFVEHIALRQRRLASRGSEARGEQRFKTSPPGSDP